MDSLGEIKIIEIASEISNQTMFPVLIFGGSLMVIYEKTLYNPSDHIFHNNFIGKVVDSKFIMGNNFREVQSILDKTSKIRVTLSHNTEYKIVGS